MVPPQEMTEFVPVQCICGVQCFTESIQERRSCLEDDDVVNHHGNQHHHHLQLIVDPQEHWAWQQAQNTAVDEVLEADAVTERHVRPDVWFVMSFMIHNAHFMEKENAARCVQSRSLCPEPRICSPAFGMFTLLYLFHNFSYSFLLLFLNGGHI